MNYQPDSNDEMPDWLQDLPDEPEDNSESETHFPLDEKESIPEEQTPADEQTLPDEADEPSSDTEWLDGFLDDETEEDDSPEWLKNIREINKMTGSLDLSAEDIGKEPDWLGDLDPLSNQTEETPTEEVPSEIEDEITQPEDAQEDLDPVDDPKPDEQPEWLEKIRSQQVNIGNRPDSDDEQKKPDWLESIRDKHFNDTQKQEVYSEESEQDQKEEIPEDATQADAPDWLHGLEEKSGFSQPEEKEAPVSNGDLPNWLQDIMAGSSQEEEILDNIPIDPDPTDDEITEDEAPESEETSEEVAWVEQFNMDGIEIPQEELPDWVFEPSESPEPEEEEETPELEAAEIPTWLDDFVPEGMADTIGTPTHQPEDVYLKGPLVDLTNPLPLEPAIKKIDPPNIPTQDILLTDIQEKHVSFIFDLIKSEGAGQKVDSRKISVPQPILQIIITIAIIAGIIFPIFGQKDVKKSGSIPINIQQFNDEITDLTENDNVLVAVDYQASFAGELEVGLGLVLNEVLSTGAEINFISSNPVGPGLIEHLIKSQFPSESSSHSSIGYISGGSAALLNFAENPKETAITYFEEHETLSSISNIKDYSMVIVVTDDLNNARSWFEQVQPQLAGPINSENHSPFLMITSSQLEALVHPYFETSPQKLNGYISGLKGFAQYGTAFNSDQDADLWDGYSRGISISFLILLVGSTYQLLSSVFSNMRRQQDI